MKISFPALQKKRAILVILFALFSGLFLSKCFLTHHFQTPDESFEDFTTELFRQELSSDTISLHYTLADPSRFGIDSVPITFGSFCSDPSESSQSIFTYLKILERFESEDLSTQNRLTYQILHDYLVSSKEGLDYLFYQEPLSPIIGIHTQIPLLLSEYQFYTIEDIDTYLLLLNEFNEYFDSVIAFELQKKKQGLFMPDFQINEVITYCESFLEMENENYLLTSFEERVHERSDLSPKERAIYIARNEKLVKDVILPSYQKLIEFMKACLGSGKNEAGLCHFPKGKDAFQYMIRHDTGVSEFIPELQHMTLAQINEDISAMQKVLLDVSNDIPVSEPEQILTELKNKSLSAFPPIPDAHLEIKYVSSAMEEYLSPAFYMIPAIDEPLKNVIYINRGQTVEGLNLYTTLAHEGYPGHLYQTVYFSSQNPNPIRSLLHFGGYVEGWATYTEMMSYYLAPLSPEKATLLQKNNSLLLGLYAYADMGIHYDGWDLTKTQNFFSHYGISDEEMVKSIYQMVIGTPGNYAKYYLGYLKIYSLKKEIAAELGSKFSQMDFHKAVLDAGPAPFDILETYVKDTLL